MRERQVLEIAGATLTVSTSNGYSVHIEGDYVGYVHASVGDRWNAYLRRGDAPAEHLGKFVLDEAVRRIVRPLSSPSKKAAA